MSTMIEALKDQSLVEGQCGGKVKQSEWRGGLGEGVGQGIWKKKNSETRGEVKIILPEKEYFKKGGMDAREYTHSVLRGNSTSYPRKKRGTECEKKSLTLVT